MKIATAIKYANRIKDKVRAVNGLLATPVCQYKAVRISRIYVFGSTVKGSRFPNDLDLLIEARHCGKCRTWRQTRFDKWGLRVLRLKIAPDSREYAIKWLTRNMRKVSRHIIGEEGADIDVKVMLYPRDDLTPHMNNLTSIPESPCSTK